MKEKKHTNSFARIRARASPPAVISFARLKLYHAAKETKYKIGSRAQVGRDHATHRLKKKHFSRGFKCK